MGGYLTRVVNLYLANRKEMLGRRGGTKVREKKIKGL